MQAGYSEPVEAARPWCQAGFEAFRTPPSQTLGLRAAMEQAMALFYIARYRPQYYKDLMPYFSFVVRTQRAAATRLRNIPLNGRSRGSIIITRRGVIMG